MKVLITAASFAALATLLPAVASAQAAAPAPATGTTFYGTLGYADDSTDHLNLGIVQGRLGARFGQYFGVEGELGFGAGGDKTTVNGVDVKANLQNQEAIYGVGFLALSPQIDLLARIGYGGDRVKATATGASDTESANSWNYGVGAQYHFDDKNGVRADYTREEYVGHDEGAANVYALSYVRKF